MSRRRKSGANETPSKDQKADKDDDDKLTMNDSKVEWSEQEKSRLLDALKKDEGRNNWRWIARQVKTRTTAQVKDFASKIRTEKQASNKRPIAPREDGVLEAWINVTKRLRGDSDVDGTCIPQNQMAPTTQSEELSEKEGNKCDNHVDPGFDKSDESKEDSHDPASESTDENQTGPTSKVNHDDNEHVMDNTMEDILSTQRQMIEKIDVLDSKLEKLQSNDQASQSTLMEVLAKINERLDQLSKNTSHACCGGPVILQTTRHANVIHQPILDPCFSCRDVIRNNRTESLSVASSEDNILSFSHPLSTTSESTKTSIVYSTGNDSSKSISGKQSCMDFVSDRQNDSHPEPQMVATSHYTSSPRVTSSVCSASPVDLSESPKNNQGTLNVLTKVSCVSEREDSTSGMSREQTSPATKHSSKEDAYVVLVKESSSTPKRSQCETLVVSPSSVTGINSTPPTAKEVSTVSRQQQVSSSQVECRNMSSPLSTRHFTTAPTPVSSVNRSQMLTAPFPQPSFSAGEMVLTNSYADGRKPSSDATEMHLDYKSMATVFPDTPSTISRVPSGPSQFTAQHAVFVANSSTSSTPSCNTSDKPSSSVQMQEPQEPSPPLQKNIPPGYIALSHTPTVPHSPCTPKNTTAWQPPTVMSVGCTHSMHQRTEFRSSPASRANLLRPEEVSGRQEKVSRPDVLSAAMLLSTYVSEHSNQQDQSQWQSCLNAIISDYQEKNQDIHRQDLSPLVSVGSSPHVLMMQHELEDIYRKCRTRPQFFALRMAERLFGFDILMKSTPNGIGGKAALNPTMLDAIKIEVLQRFGSGVSPEQQTEMWKGCMTSIAQRCKRLRNPRRNRSPAVTMISNDNEGPPSMAVGKELRSNMSGNTQTDSCDEDEEYEMENLNHPSSHNTPTMVRLSSDSEQENLHGSNHDASCATENIKIHNVKQLEDSGEQLEPAVDSMEEAGEEGAAVHVPPGVDPDITVVYLPSTLETALRPKESDKQLGIALSRSNEADTFIRLKESESRNAPSPHIQEPYMHTRDSVSPGHNLPIVCKYSGDRPPIEGNIYKPGGTSAENVLVSGIKMTPDYHTTSIIPHKNIPTVLQGDLKSQGHHAAILHVKDDTSQFRQIKVKYVYLEDSENAHLFIQQDQAMETLGEANVKPEKPCEHLQQPSTKPTLQELPLDDDATLLMLHSRSASEQNFAVQLVRHFFEPHELDGRNVRGVGGKLALNPEKISKIKGIVFRFYTSSLAQQELLWRDCRRAIDAYLRNRRPRTSFGSKLSS
ncbi:uncharacterized protein LOC111338659 isoform X2 [Stylophora pistillata]|uniref:uncharacterized protein LOC111338659 isoform X2 n=1 Tax=Stylophora pistillata TaxID=50429 RepID=UPI000C04C3B5|nr:uncharacterized protein LOC111338659 isoform X2 [Stylophora pistillata]